MIILLCLMLFNNSITYVKAESEQTYYARAMFEQVYLYKTPNNNSSADNVFFEIPKTYFVILTGIANEEFYSATYMNYNGYVKKDSVQATLNTPSNPFLENLNLRVYAELSRSIMSEPTTSSATSNLIAKIPLYSRSITYYGKIQGEALIEGRTNIWYFCKFSANTDYYGYIYSDFCDELLPIPENTENVEYYYDELFTKTELPAVNSIPANSSVTGIIISILSVPAIVFFFMIIKGKNILTKPQIKDKEITDY